ncbi:hypothetical protein [Roseimicrobium sp. ORNL1]|uniref:hypothetical protein n=1 Tax=Roseimicrobium sp. ORNL1 TaxID=2711231 RepID=UPI0013E1B14D|nr:hypothetical protein [Roseimicrobium sp. ORNL1]QIF00788.1 hypothetical protein G5S37_04365 [Roseimicrobium sp. ORNL1]
MMEDPFELFESIKGGVSKFFLGDALMGLRPVYRDSGGNLEIHLGLYRRKHEEEIVQIKFVPVEGVFRFSSGGVTVRVSSFQEFAEFLENSFKTATSELYDQQEIPFGRRFGLILGEGALSSMFVAEYHEREGRHTPFGPMTSVPFRLHAFTNRKEKVRILLGDSEWDVVFDAEALVVLASNIREYMASSRQTPA